MELPPLHVVFLSVAIRRNVSVTRANFIMVQNKVTIGVYDRIMHAARVDTALHPSSMVLRYFN